VRAARLREITVTARRGDWSTASPANALVGVRVIWGGLLLGPVALLVVVVAVGHGSERDLGDLAMFLFGLEVAFLVVAAVVGGFARKQIYKRHWQADAITPRGYVLGNILLLTLLEAASLFGLVLTMLHGRLIPMVLPAMIAMGLHAVNFPTGGPMQPAPMRRRAEA